ncbi:probable inactive poly [ADP-ribose] polymerase SRO1 isoform X2 [Magnolia sinica]|uniref:probable inactive poly [ADP-ribose] polymerase SRO1 isoform X2 n=1 Tax=Magnolia sinica TaxID=86752 RepID=UPI00265857B9|nr:probable inactive poly [ADP-ribose] polymerase SRO1 isoform X2 [Magnolia sinica]
MKENIRDNLSSIITDKSRNELSLSLMKKKRATKIANRIKSLISRPISSHSANLCSSVVDRCDIESGFCFRRALVLNSSNFRRSNAPSRFMFFQDNAWSDFSKEVFGFLKSGFVAGMPAIEVAVEGSPYLFDFLRMLQMDFETGCPKSIAWIDVNGQCFFPKLVVGGEIQAPCDMPPFPKLEIEIKIDRGVLESSCKSLRRKRDRSNFADEGTDENHSNDCNIPKRVEPKIHTVDSERPKWPCVEILKDGDKGFRVIKNLFLDGIRQFSPNTSVTSVCRCLHTSPLRNANLKAFQSQIEMTKAARGNANVRLAWHGTSAQGIAGILTHGFGQPNRFPSSEAYGVGVYLSPQHSSHASALLSEADENGERHVLLCRVIVGNAEKVEVGSLCFHPSSEEFDVGVDDLLNPKWYIVWSTHMNSHILPEYVVSYKSSDHLQGLWRPAGPLRKASTSPNLSFQKLFSEMRNSLPSSRLQALECLYTHYKGREKRRD